MTYRQEKAKIQDQKETIERLQQELVEKSNFIFTLIDVASDLSRQNRKLMNDYNKLDIKLRPTQAMKPNVQCYDNCSVLIQDCPANVKKIIVLDSFCHKLCEFYTQPGGKVDV